MTLPTITRDEFDMRLAHSTEQMRQRRMTLEAQAAELVDLIGRYSAVLECLGTGQEAAEYLTYTMQKGNQKL